MELTASDLYSLHRPSYCTLRIFLKHLGIEEDEPSPYVEVLRILGERHEKDHLSEFKEYVDLSGEEWSTRIQRTIDLVHQQVPVIYQPMMRATLTINNEDCIVLGVPDFLILEQNNYLIRDSKITKRITEKDHPEILLQLQLYGWLFEETFGKQPLALQVHNGPGDIIEIPNDSGNSLMQVLDDIVQLKQSSTEPFSPVGWSKCGNCGYKNRCWEQAVSDKLVAIVPEVDQGLAQALHNEGIYMITDLITQFNEDQLAEYKRPWERVFSVLVGQQNQFYWVLNH